MNRIVTLLCLTLLAFQAGLVNAQSLQRHADRNQPLDARWRWALNEVQNKSAWVVWRFDTVLNETLLTDINAGYRGGTHQHHALSLDALLAGNTSPQQGFATPRRLALLAQFRDGQLIDVDSVDTAQAIPFTGSVIWLGDASSTASYRLLLSLLDSSQQPRLKRGLIRAIALHSHSQRTAFLNSLLSTPAWTDMRQHILYALTLQHSTAVETLLLQLAADPELVSNERRIAVSALRHYGSDASLALLIRLTDATQHGKLRQEAVESLAWFNPAQVIPTLQQVAWFDASTDVREEAIDSLAQLHSDAANALILSIARNHPSAPTREQAMHRLQEELF